MEVTVKLNKEEFLDYINFQNFKSNVNCGIISLEVNYNNLLKQLLEDGIWKDNNKYDKIILEINKDINTLKVVDSK